jgi:hypothetical protein
MNIWRRNAFFPQDQLRLSSACDNRLPFWDSCPCASTTRLGNDSAAFDRQGRLEPFCDGTLYQDYTIRWQFAPSHSLLIAVTSRRPNDSERPSYTNYCDFYTCGPQTSPQWQLLHFVEKCWDAHGLDKHMETKFNTFQTRSQHDSL